MRAFLVRLCVWMPLFGVLLCFVSPASRGTLKIQEVVSSRGIKAWLVEDHTIPVISLRLSFKAGAAYVPVEKAGLVDVLSHMLDEGAGPYSSREFNEKLQKLAIGLRFDCDLDEFKVFLKTTTKHYHEAFDLLKLALTQPGLEMTEFEKVRSASIAALKVQKKTPDYLAERAFHETFMAGHPYATPVSGTEKTLQGLMPHDILSLHRGRRAPAERRDDEHLHLDEHRRGDLDDDRDARRPDPRAGEPRGDADQPGRAGCALPGAGTPDRVLRVPGGIPAAHPERGVAACGVEGRDDAPGRTNDP